MCSSILKPVAKSDRIDSTNVFFDYREDKMNQRTMSRKQILPNEINFASEFLDLISVDEIPVVVRLFLWLVESIVQC